MVVLVMAGMYKRELRNGKSAGGSEIFLRNRISLASARIAARCVCPSLRGFPLFRKVCSRNFLKRLLN